MTKSHSQALERFDSSPDVSLRISGAAKVLEAKRGGLTIRVTVPDDVLEWFVDVVDGTAVVLQDWWDYEGYDDTPKEALAQSMASDIDDFLVKLLERDIRLVPATRTRIDDFVAKLLHRDIKLFPTKPTLEWMTNGSWEQALPFL